MVWWHHIMHQLGIEAFLNRCTSKPLSTLCIPSNLLSPLPLPFPLPLHLPLALTFPEHPANKRKRVLHLVRVVGVMSQQGSGTGVGVQLLLRGQREEAKVRIEDSLGEVCQEVFKETTHVDT